MTFIKRSILQIILSVLLVMFTFYVALDTFVIPQVYSSVSTEQTSGALTSGSGQSGSTASDEASSGGSGSSGTAAAGSTDAETTDSSYSDDNISVNVTTYRKYDTSIYVADVKVSSPEYLKTVLANNSYGRNVTEKTSEIAEEAGSILAINGDFYGAQESGYVIRNGVIYRDTSAGKEDLVIYEDGSFGVIDEDDVTAEELLEKGAQQVLSFGPALVENGQVSVSENEEVGKAMASNPRTAIGIIDDCHYVFVVSDGRTSESEGLTLSQMAEFMQGLGVTTAYNLDGGGSSTMYFNGQVVNKPTTNGRSISERSVSDIVSIGY